MNKAPYLLVLVLLAVMGFREWTLERKLASADDKYATQTKVTETTEALLAKEKVNHSADAELLKAAKAMGGKLVAAVTIKVPAKADSGNHSTLVTVAAKDSTRTAEVHDTTKVGVLDATLTAPPFPAALGFKYKITQPAFSPQVGFVVRQGKGYAIVHWEGEEYEIADPYIVSIPDPKRVVPFTTVLVEPGSVLTVRGGVELRLPFWGITGSLEGEQRVVLGEPVRVMAGLRKDWR